MSIARLRAARSTGVLLVALTVMTSPAAAGMGPGDTYGVSPDGVVATQLSQCPCFVAGGPPGGLPAMLALRAANREEQRARGADVRVTPAPAGQPGGAFDWTDASVGAGFALAVGMLVAGGAWVFSRRRVHGQLTAGSRR